MMVLWHVVWFYILSKSNFTFSITNLWPNCRSKFVHLVIWILICILICHLSSVKFYFSFWLNISQFRLYKWSRNFSLMGRLTNHINLRHQSLIFVLFIRNNASLIFTSIIIFCWRIMICFWYFLLNLKPFILFLLFILLYQRCFQLIFVWFINQWGAAFLRCSLFISYWHIIRCVFIWKYPIIICLIKLSLTICPRNLPWWCWRRFRLIDFVWLKCFKCFCKISRWCDFHPIYWN